MIAATGGAARGRRAGAAARIVLALASLALAAGIARGQASVPAPGSAAGAAGKCGVCHPAERVQFEASVHARERMGCTSCHGGDDRSLTLGVAHGSGFRGRPSRAGIPSLCASCHSNERKMRPYNLPVDQHALYQTSEHGVRLAMGDTRVAVCSDCHGAHDVLARTDPSSRVFPTNIARTCGSCHGDRKLFPERWTVMDEYAKSVHAAALLERGNLRAPTCVSCHGTHGAAPPAFGDVDKVCGQCHTAERRYFTAGAHRPDLPGRPECSTCHGKHDVQPTKPERVAGICTQCHAPASAQAALGQRLWVEYKSAADEIEKARAIAARAEAVPINTEDYRARLEEATTYLQEALPAAHAVNEELVSGFTTRARSVAAEVESELYGKLGNLRVRRFVLILFWFYLLLTIVVLRRFQNRAARAG